MFERYPMRELTDSPASSFLWQSRASVPLCIALGMMRLAPFEAVRLRRSPLKLPQQTSRRQYSCEPQQPDPGPGRSRACAPFSALRPSLWLVGSKVGS